MNKALKLASLVAGISLMSLQAVWAESKVPYEKLPLAPEKARIDRYAPVFSNPTKIDHPLFPVSTLEQKIQLGEVDGERKRVEFTLLPETKIIEWRGQKIETRIVQFIAYSDGEIEEVALDFHAQADDGSVWYFGEDVFDYKDGVVALWDGTWLAGRDGPPALIMPAKPKVGDVYRAEDIPNVVFEENTVLKIDQTYENGPRGPVPGMFSIRELHMDGTFEAKSFAPGYGEFLAPGENAAVAIPTDVLTTPEPLEITTLYDGAMRIAQSGEVDSKAMSGIVDALKLLTAERRPPLLVEQMTLAIEDVSKAVKAKEEDAIRKTAISMALAALDFRMQYRPLKEIERDRLTLWSLRSIVDAEANELPALTGDIAVLEWIWKRSGHHVNPDQAGKISVALSDLRTAATRGDPIAGMEAAKQLQEVLAAS